MTLDSKDIPDLNEWCQAHDVPESDDDLTRFVRGMKWGVGLSAVFWTAFAVGVVSC